MKIRSNGRLIKFLEDVMKKYVRAYLSEPLERISAIRTGVEQEELVALAADLKIPIQRLRLELGVSSRSRRYSTHASERIIGLMALIGQVDTMVHRSNPNVKFDAAGWLGRWLKKPVGALGGIQPETFLDTMAGLAILSDLLALSESGALA